MNASVRCRQQERDYIVRVEVVEFGRVGTLDLTIRAGNARAAASEARRAGYRPVIATWRAKP